MDLNPCPMNLCKRRQDSFDPAASAGFAQKAIKKFQTPTALAGFEP